MRMIAKSEVCVWDYANDGVSVVKLIGIFVVLSVVFSIVSHGDIGRLA
jgi:hypothetical protein